MATFNTAGFTEVDSDVLRKRTYQHPPSQRWGSAGTVMTTDTMYRKFFFEFSHMRNAKDTAEALARRWAEEQQDVWVTVCGPGSGRPQAAKTWVRPF